MLFFEYFQLFVFEVYVRIVFFISLLLDGFRGVVLVNELGKIVVYVIFWVRVFNFQCNKFQSFFFLGRVIYNIRDGSYFISLGFRGLLSFRYLKWICKYTRCNVVLFMLQIFEGYLLLQENLVYFDCQFIFFCKNIKG